MLLRASELKKEIEKWKGIIKMLLLYFTKQWHFKQERRMDDMWNKWVAKKQAWSPTSILGLRVSWALGSSSKEALKGKNNHLHKGSFASKESRVQNNRTNRRASDYGERKLCQEQRANNEGGVQGFQQEHFLGKNKEINKK